MTIFPCLITNLHKIVAFEATVSSSDGSRNIASHRSPNRTSFFDEDDDRIRLLSSYDYFNFKKIRINHLLTTIIDESNCIKNYFSIQVTNSIGDDINVIDASQLTNDDCKRYLNFIYSGLVIHMMGCLQALFNQFIAKYSKDSIVFDNQLLFVPLGCIREYRQTMSNPAA